MFYRFTLLAADFVPHRLGFQAALGGVGEVVYHNPRAFGFITIHTAEGQQAILFEKVVDVRLLMFHFALQVVHHFFIPTLRLKQDVLLLLQAVVNEGTGDAVGDISGFCGDLASIDTETSWVVRTPEIVRLLSSA